MLEAFFFWPLRVRIRKVFARAQSGGAESRALGREREKQKVSARSRIVAGD